MELYGFEEILPSLLEKYDLVTKKSTEYFKRNVYKTIDLDGSLLALRPDITPSVIRMVSDKTYQEPLKLYYLNNSFRMDKNPREFWQAGAEIFSKKQEYDGEVISLSIELMEKLDVKDFFVDIGNIDFLWNIVKKFKIPTQFIQDLEQGDLISAELLLQKCESSSVEFLRNLINKRGDGKKLYDFKNELDNTLLEKDLDDLIYIYEYLKDCGQEDKVIFDLGLVRDPTYYTGIIFEGYTPQTGKELLSGGRYEYDDISGVGFAVDLDLLIKTIDIPVKENEKIVVAYSEKRKESLELVKKLRSEGKIVYLLSETDKNKIKDFARKKNAEIKTLENFE